MLLKWLLYCINLAVAAYCPTKPEMAALAACREEDILTFEPDTNPTRPAYAIGVDHTAKRVVMTFRGEPRRRSCGQATPCCRAPCRRSSLAAALPLPPTPHPQQHAVA